MICLAVQLILITCDAELLKDLVALYAEHHGSYTLESHFFMQAPRQPPLTPSR
jgi:hypothetical protein